MHPIAEAAAFSVAVVAMIIGLLGVILPVLPGLILIWAAALFYAVVEKFATVDPFTFIFITLLAAAGISADIWLTQLGAKLGGAQSRSLITGLLGGLVGALAFMFFGGVTAGLGAMVGSVAGVLLAEYRRSREWPIAFKAVGGWMLGWLASTLLQLLLGAAIILLFVWQVLLG